MTVWLYQNVMLVCLHAFLYLLYRMIKIKNSKKVGIEFNSATKSKETRNKILGQENILA